MKTFREWFEEFPEPYKTQAINNFKNIGGNMNGLDQIPFYHSSLKAVLNSAFDFEKSPEGWDYWENFYQTL